METEDVPDESLTHRRQHTVGNSRWYEEIEDVPDRQQSWGVASSNQQLKGWDRESIRFRHTRYDSLFNNDIARQSENIAFTMGRNQRWSEETEDVPDKILTYGRQQKVGNSRWSGETEDVPDRHPRYRRS